MINLIPGLTDLHIFDIFLQYSKHLFEYGDNSDATATPATTPGAEDKLMDFSKDLGSSGKAEDIQLLKLKLEEASI